MIKAELLLDRARLGSGPWAAARARVSRIKDQVTGRGIVRVAVID
jgi:hypothetical protein